MTISESFALEALRRNRPTARIGPSLCDPKSLKHPRAKNSSRQLMCLGLSWPMEFRDSFCCRIGTYMETLYRKSLIADSCANISIDSFDFLKSLFPDGLSGRASALSLKPIPRQWCAAMTAAQKLLLESRSPGFDFQKLWDQTKVEMKAENTKPLQGNKFKINTEMPRFFLKHKDNAENGDDRTFNFNTVPWPDRHLYLLLFPKVLLPSPRRTQTFNDHDLMCGKMSMRSCGMSIVWFRMTWIMGRLQYWYALRRLIYDMCTWPACFLRRVVNHLRRCNLQRRRWTAWPGYVLSSGVDAMLEFSSQICL